MHRRTFCRDLAGLGLSTSLLRCEADAAALQDTSSARPDDEQREALDLLLRVLTPSRVPATGRINAVDRTWEDWQKRTGELPPKFSALPSQPFLPDVLTGIRAPSDWSKRRKEIRAQMEHWLIGRMPPAPDNLRAIVTAEKQEGDITVRDVRLEFGPDHRGVLHIQLLIPPGHEPRPAFLTNHNRARPWAATAVARGYLGVIYFAADPIYGFEDDSDKFIELYPDYDFSCLARWAWAASRAIDYLYTLPEVDRRYIAISGHSRNAKQAVIAGAFDERITAVVPSSGNTGEGNPWRYTTDPFVTESIEQITTVFPHWFHPRLRFFAGREDRLPFDQNSVLALIAPRSLLLTCSYTEDQGSDFGFEQNYRAIRKVYDFLGAPNNVGLRLRTGPHPTTAGDIEVYLDFLDNAFGRKSGHAPAPTFVFGYTFDGWKAASGENSPSKPEGNKLAWALGPEPPQVPFPSKGPEHIMVSAGWMELLYGRPLKGKVMKAVAVPFGVDLKADLYLPLRPQGKLPIVVWLHPFSYSTGYSRYAKAPFEELTARGYGVLAFDQIGFGTRVEHAKDFYRRYPTWSLLGKMVADTRAAITAAASLDAVDASRIYLLGYSLGAKVALWTAALDPRPAAIVSVAGITPLRTSKGTEGVRAYSHLHGLLPRLGFYAENPSTLPFDYDDVLQAIGNRKTLVVAPTHDRYADRAALQQLLQPFKNIEVQTPEDFNRFPARTQQLVFDWLDRQRT
ncbi:MAG TPA: alpha/beta fold hydrolase [Bryobacteraceae bacterium]|nr:alpha/beta fold hydrolase [Bryobacteraceae bacterium]